MRYRGVSAAAVLMVLPTRTASAEVETRLPPKVAVHVAANPEYSTMVDRARPDVTRIYAGIGVELVWVDRVDAHVTIQVAWKPLKGLNATSLGVACRGEDGTGRLAYAFYGRIENFARVHDKPVAHVLAHVMAHELGHLLLPHGSHSASGLMTAGWDRKQIELIGRGWLAFTDEQGATIRERRITIRSGRDR
jgi:hypothetical protein